jgi:hypothetical protein
MRIRPFSVAPAQWYNAIRRRTMSEIIFVVQEDPEGGYRARALGESIFTEADTVSELRENVRDAIRCHFNEGEAPTVVKVESHGLCLSQFQAG